MPVNPELKFPCLYKPETAEELLTEPILGKLMLGFTSALGMPVALEDRTKKRYDLFGKPKEHFCKFCSTIRSDKFGLEQACFEWDKKVADVLLGDRPEEYPGQIEEFSKLFKCHMKMIDLAEVIYLGGRRFAVLHGGQIKPTAQKWRLEMENRLTELLFGCTEEEIKELLSLVEDMPPQKNTPSECDKEFRKFARELETVFEQSYQHRRAASEESLLKAVLESLMDGAITDWQTWWNQLNYVLSELCAACRLSRIAFFVGKDKANPFELELRASSKEDKRGECRIKVGSYWEVIRYKSIIVENQNWSKELRELLSIEPNERCVISASTCRVGTPANLFPSVMVWIGDEIMTPDTPQFLGKLATEISRILTMVCNRIELSDVISKSSAAAAYGAHDVKFPLHAAFQLAERNRHALTRLKIQDPEVINDADMLIAALEEAKNKNKATPLEKMPLRGLNIQCVLHPLDVIPLIDKAISIALTLGENRGINVKWGEKPLNPVIINADKDYLSTAIHAIFDNAVKYSFDNREVRVFGCVENGKFNLRVSDFGVGIPQEKELTLFEFGERAEVENFYNGKERKGKGLGLAFAYRIINAHSGYIYLMSTPSAKERFPNGDLYHEVSAHIQLPLSEKR